MFDFFKKPQPVKPADPAPSFFSTDLMTKASPMTILSRAIARTFLGVPLPSPVAADGSPMTGDSSSVTNETKTLATLTNTIPEAQIGWYSGQGFIGYQMCAMIAQQWLVDKACTMPARDAVRTGYEITVNDGTEVSPEILDAIRKLDEKFLLVPNIVEFVRMGRIFGIRIAMFKVDSDDPDYYTKPFNPDGVTAGSYRGISQIDPYWITPQLDFEATNPQSIDFYEPTWWQVNGVRIHKSHLIIFRNSEVPDLLKPAYVYGGISVPQKIYERVYAAERTANEAPQLALTKRTTIIHADMSQVMANQADFEDKLNIWAQYRDNYGVKVLGLEENAEQFDTALGDLDATVMTQYQLVAAAANVPATKLLGTTPKGFNASGTYEESSYHEELESIQTHDLTRLINRHHLLLIRSEIAPKLGIAPFSTTVNWNPLDTPTAKELADMNKVKADTDAILVGAGALDGMDIRARLIADPASGYSGISDDPEEIEGEEAESDSAELPEEKTEETKDAADPYLSLAKTLNEMQEKTEAALAKIKIGEDSSKILGLMSEMKDSILEGVREYAPQPQQPIINITQPAAPAINIPAPTVNVTMPDVKVTAPEITIKNEMPKAESPNVTVTMPDVRVNVSSPAIDFKADIQSPDVKVSMPARKTETTVEYDREGNIKSTTQIERDAD